MPDFPPQMGQETLSADIQVNTFWDAETSAALRAGIEAAATAYGVSIMPEPRWYVVRLGGPDPSGAVSKDVTGISVVPF